MAISDLSNKRALHTLQTERLFLRAVQASDLDDLFEIFNDEDVMRYWSCPPHTDKKQTNSYLTSMIASPTNGTLDFSLVLSSPRSSANGKVIGKIGIWDADNQEIGFMLNRSYWGKGYMAEALATVLPHIWKQGVRRIVADVDPRNKASLRSLKRFGFQEMGRAERTFETHLGWCDSVYLALEKPKP